MPSSSAPPPDACTSCADPLGPDRRAFLRHAALAAASALVGLGAAASDASARPLDFVSASARDGETRTYPLPAADGAVIDRDAEVILVRWQGAVYAFNLACPHQHTALRWIAGESRFQCPKHKSKYQPDGAFISGRATRGMDRFAVRRDGGGVVVDLAVLHRQDTDPNGWAAAVARS